MMTIRTMWLSFLLCFNCSCVLLLLSPIVNALRKDVPFAHHRLNNNKNHQHHHPILSIRGGGSGGREGAYPSSSVTPPSLALIGQTSIELAKHVWDYGSYAVSNKVVPLANDRILKPIRNVLEDSATTTTTTTTTSPPLREKINEGEREQQQQQQQRDRAKTAAATTTTATLTPVHTKQQRPTTTTTTTSTTARSSFSVSSSQQRRRNNDDNGSMAKGDKKNNNIPILKVLLLPKRILKIGLTSWLLCEYLDFIGILNEETPVILKSQVDRVWYEEVRPRLSNIVMQIRLLAGRAIGRIFEVQIPIKYQFAIGTMTGMVASPLFPILAGFSVRSTILLYGVAELYSYYKSRNSSSSSSSSSLILDYENVAFGPVRVVGKTIDNTLEHIRERVHRVFIDQQGNEYPLLTSRQAIVSCNGGKKHDIHTRQYNLSLTSDRTTQKATTPGGGRATAASITASNSSLLRRKSSKDLIVLNGQRIPNNGMISHGFLIGGALGLFFGL